MGTTVLMCERHSNVAVIDLYRVAGNAELFVPISCSRGGRLDLAATTATAAALAATNSTVPNVLYGFKWPTQPDPTSNSHSLALARCTFFGALNSSIRRQPSHRTLKGCPTEHLGGAPCHAGNKHYVPHECRKIASVLWVPRF